MRVYMRLPVRVCMCLLSGKSRSLRREVEAEVIGEQQDY